MTLTAYEFKSEEARKHWEKKFTLMVPVFHEDGSIPGGRSFFTLEAQLTSRLASGKELLLRILKRKMGETADIYPRNK